MRPNHTNPRSYRQYIGRLFAKGDKASRKWVAVDGAKAVSFLQICTTKLSDSEIADLSLGDIQRASEDLFSDKIDKEQLLSMEADEFHNFITGKVEETDEEGS